MTQHELKVQLYDVIEQQAVLQQQFQALEQRKNTLLQQLNKVREQEQDKGESGERN